MNPIDQSPRRVRWALASLLICLPFAPLPAGADSFVVANTADSGAGSLRQGVIDSNDVVAPPTPVNTLNFSPSVIANSTIQLASPLENIANDLTIDGTSPGGLTIAGDGIRFLTVDAGKKLTLNDITFDSGDLLLGSAANLTYNVTTGSITIDEVIGDAPASSGGILEKTGAGTLILTGANTFTGAAQVKSGTLQVMTNSLSADASVSSGGNLRFTQAPDSSYGGIISGAGAVEKSGAGTLTLTGVNSYAGGTTVTTGTLTGIPGAIQGDVLIQSGATLDILDNTGSTYTGTISGTGSFIQSGVGTLVLAPTGTNSWTNAQVSSGGLQGDAAAISGNVDLVGAAATLLVDEAGTGTVAGDLSGAGLFEKLGVGTVTLTGDNTGLTNASPGAFTVQSGTLIGDTTSIPSNALVQGIATLVFDQSADGSYANVVTGLGDVEKRGNGRVTFNAAQTYAGTTTISGGRLDVLGGLASSSTSIASGATLGGTGTLVGPVANSGRIAPGTSIGTLTVDSVSFASGSTLEIEVDPSPASDRLVVTNAAILSGGTLDVLLAPGVFTSQTSTILTAGSITGSLAFTDNFPLVDITLLQGANALQLTVTANSGMLAPVARTRNQRAVATALDTETPASDPDLALVIQSFTTLTTSEFLTALDSLSGETITQFTTARLEHADQFDLALHSRLRESTDSLDLLTRPQRKRGEGLLPDVSERGPDSSAPTIDFWFEPYAVFGDIDGQRGASDVDYTLIGGAIGAEAVPFSNSSNALRDIRLGAAFGYGYSDIDFSDRSGSGTANSYMGALYAGWEKGRLRAGLSSRVGYSQMDSKRTVVVGTLVRSADADINGLDFGTRFEAGGKWIETDRYLLETYASLDYTHLEQEAFTESGAISVNLRVDREKIDSLHVGVGTRLRGIFEMDPKLWLLPELRAEWHQQLLDRDRTINANFLGAAVNPGFAIRGAELQRNSAIVGVGWGVRSDTGFEAAVDYDLGINAESLAHAVSIRVGTHW